VESPTTFKSFGRFLESGRFPKGGALWSRLQARNSLYIENLRQLAMAHSHTSTVQASTDDDVEANVAEKYTK
jgi:hypothetical protein